MELATLVGVSINEFWKMTPFELNIVAESYSKKRKQEYKDKIILEYLNAKWTIQWLGKKSQRPKPLNEILDNLYGEKKEKKEMTDEQMLAQVKALNTMFGGKVKKI